ncbi:ATP-dependent nuclease [Maridesulfovibrio frigidus]|uniref:ATP-dependent nuclease n=1 Tax=Maridesulfovibrio frigidus TaxID=340956 RepID=UPI0004E1666A|nr:ATP-dependent endonuclease [Maridesulfovibrio frigidus]
MKICKITVENFRLLKDFSIDLEDELSLVVGKNNVGKTSLLTVLEKFLGSKSKGSIAFDDFNIEFKNYLYKLIDDKDANIEEGEQLGIKLRLYIKYNEDDDLSNISSVLMDLDPENNYVILGFDYLFKNIALQQAKQDFAVFVEKKGAEKECDLISLFLSKKYSDYFDLDIKSLAYDIKSSEIREDAFISLLKENISLKNILNFQCISARRDVSNKGNDGSLSAQTSKMYKRIESSDDQNKTVDEFQEKLAETDSELTGIYSKLFQDVIEKVSRFGGIVSDESVIEIVSTLQHRELLAENTTVTYAHGDESLPEHYNGLGYMNLISIIFQIEILVTEFRRSKKEKPADINLLFIEEPEAHTHPQMQYIFIKNIKSLLAEGIVREDKDNRKLQYVITSHSSHIVSESDFNDIKYLKKETPNSVVARNLSELEKYYTDKGEEKSYRFLKQYLTLNRAELFFADKAILIEGDTERILLPAVMKKVDQQDSSIPLLSQNISIVEVGAYSHIFEHFIDFIGMKKCLIITDIDCGYLKEVIDKDGNPQFYKNGNPKLESVKCPASSHEVSFTSNASLKSFYPREEESNIDYFKGLKFEEKVFLKRDGEWAQDVAGSLAVTFQTEEQGYHARSFEDAFFHLNKEFIISNKDSFCSLKPTYLDLFENDEIDVFDFAERAVNSKASFSIEILLNSETDATGQNFSNWEIPIYIREGLEWLRK